MTTTDLRKSIDRSPLPLGFFLIPFAIALAGLALSPQARAVCQHGCLINLNTALGDDALLTGNGTYSTAVGFNALLSNRGDTNTAIGAQALLSNTIGSANTATGAFALVSNTTGSDNTATGDQALWLNTTGSYNTANGSFALSENTEGNFNTANGYLALGFNTTGSKNTGIGVGAVGSNAAGNSNTATGFAALYGNFSTGSHNTANGAAALFSNLGSNNSASGSSALYGNTTGNNNTAIGTQALENNTSGNGNVALGFEAGRNLTIGGHNIDIGNRGIADEAHTIRIGNVGTQTATFIAGISGATVPTGVAVIVDANGHLGTTTSSARFKNNVQAMDKASEAILALRSVTFRYKHELDPDGIPQFGLVAEEVEKVNPDLVARDEEGKPYTVRYEAVNAMLLNEFLKEHRTMEELKKEIAALTATVKEQASQIQRVSAELEVRKSSPQIVVNNQ